MITSTLNESILRDIAGAGNGSYFGLTITKILT